MQGIFDSNIANTPAVVATGTNGAGAIKATSDGGTVVEATSDARTALLGGTNTGIGVIGRSLRGGIGVLADSDTGVALNALSKNAIAVMARSDSSFGVVGTAPNAGVAAFNPTNQNAAYLASDCCAAWLTGDVHVSGKLSKGGGGFSIDHPLDPADKFLSHSFVESSEMKNVYDGIAVADSNGEATVQLPSWFETLNRDPRYQLTPLGGPAPELHVSGEVDGNRFKIAGATPGLRVCWQITGVRQDAWANANRLVVEEPKSMQERGCFLHPELHGAPRANSIGEVRHPRPTNL